MNVKEKRTKLIEFFRQTLLDQTKTFKDADENEKEMLDLQMEKTKFSLMLMEEGSTVLNGEKAELSDTKIEMMYRNYFEDPAQNCGLCNK